MLTLLQTGKRDTVPVVFLDAPGGDFWQSFDQFVRDCLVRHETISPDDLALYKLTDDCDEAVDEILTFFRVYHSMRYVKNQLVLRLSKKPDPDLPSALTDRYGDILVDGAFELCDALPDEKDEPDLADLPRLTFQFNRRDHGRLRQLIDDINRGHVG